MLISGIIMAIRENAERAVDMRQIRPVLVKLPLHFINDAGKLASLGDQTGDNDVLGHAAALCQ